MTWTAAGLHRYPAKTFTWSQADAPKADAPKAAPALIVIRNKVYDISGDFVSWHPGGAVALSQVGYEASGAFEAFHDAKAWTLLSKYYVGDLAASEIVPPTPFLQDIQKLRTLVKQKGWDKASKAYYAAKFFSNMAILGISLLLLAKFGKTVAGTAVSSLFMALFWQQSGWLAHDFLHHQVFKNRAINNALGYFIGNVCQGFSVAWWKNKHCTHHSTTNIHSRDPDIDTLPYLAWSEHALEGFADIGEHQAAEFLVKYQPILYFPLLTFARLTWAIQSLLWSAKPKSERTFPTLPLVERVTLVAHYAWLVTAIYFFSTPVLGFFWISLAQLLCGIFLASVFSLNHNGMPVYSVQDAQKMEFYEISIRTGRNVDPTHFNNWFTGGLNYQIEHHMFPTIPRNNLKYVAPIVEDICKRHNIPYHTTSFGAGMVEVVARLGSIARLAHKMKLE
ncbi:fatty acid desaturase-domain-containing protein [Entophlyctis helioformis]|nr:fatty acid desaturase-domain-containing protein [Entophlyctis helioformis]